MVLGRASESPGAGDTLEPPATEKLVTKPARRGAKRGRSEAPEIGEAGDPPAATVGSFGEEGEVGEGGDPDEMEAADSIVKRRRSEAPETGEADEPPAAAAGNPPGVEEGDEEEGVDHISFLPDAVLADIISLLPTKDAARTQTLASRWRQLWRSAPLNLDCSGIPGDDDALVGVVSGILAAHTGPGRSFCIPSCHLQNRPATVDGWLRSPALGGLQELEFLYDDRRMSGPVLQPAPASAFRFSSSLRVAIISQCILPDSTAQTLHFPQLKKLSLQEVTISDDSLHQMVAGCPALESLLVNHYWESHCIRINSPTLRSVAVSSGEIIIEDAPCLERLIRLDLSKGLHITVISAPKLETLGCLFDGPGSTRIVFGTTVFEELRAVSLTTVMHTVKILSILIYTLSLDMVIDLMKLFPCLEKLYIQPLVSGEKNLWRRKYHSFIKCQQIRLKTIVLARYQGIKAHINFAMFFVLNAPMLELVRFELQYCRCNPRFIAWQHEVLQLENRASRDAQFHFTNDTCLHDLTNNRHNRDLSIADSFECRC